MKKKLIVLGLVSTLLVGCGSTKPASDGCCEAPKVTQNDRVTLGVLFSGMVLFILHTATTR